jgi:hypothetical protein
MFFFCRPLPAIALAQARQAGLNGKRKYIPSVKEGTLLASLTYQVT